MKSARSGSMPRFVVLTALAACLSSGLANAQTLKDQSGLAAATRGGAAILPAREYHSSWNAAAAHLKYTPPDPCHSAEPPDPCTPGQWAKLLLAEVEAVL
jgi:hypothetical protein